MCYAFEENNHRLIIRDLMLKDTVFDGYNTVFHAAVCSLLNYNRDSKILEAEKAQQKLYRSIGVKIYAEHIKKTLHRPAGYSDEILELVNQVTTEVSGALKELNDDIAFKTQVAEYVDESKSCEFLLASIRNKIAALARQSKTMTCR